MTTWIKVYNSLPAHPKMLAAVAGTPCSSGWLFVCGSCYSNEHLTDGFIPAYALAVVAPGTTKVEAAARKLVAAGLWHEVEGGWRIHDYGDVQRSAGEIRERRAKDAERKATARSNGSPSNVHADTGPDSDGTPHGQAAESSRARDRAPSQDVDVEGREQKADVEDTSSSGADGADMKIADEDRRLCALLRARAEERNPKFKVKSRPRWLTDMRLLRERDGNEPSEIDRAIRWVFADDFWGGVIQSPGNLREHFPAIWDRMNRNVIPIRGDGDLDRRRLEAAQRLMNGGQAS